MYFYRIKGGSITNGCYCWVYIWCCHSCRGYNRINSHYVQVFYEIIIFQTIVLLLFIVLFHVHFNTRCTLFLRRRGNNHKKTPRRMLKLDQKEIDQSITFLLEYINHNLFYQKCIVRIANLYPYYKMLHCL